MTPLVTCIVPHHLDENHEYLKLCLDSILASEGVDFEIVCVADTKERPRYERQDERLFLLWDQELNTASSKLNWAAKRARGKYLWLISDDVMVSNGAMKTMVEGVGDNAIICNPMSNSDNGSQFFAKMDYPVKLSKEDVDFGSLSIEEYSDGTSHAFLIPVRHFVSFYCTMIPKKVWDLVGELDEKMDVRGNDWDYCLRAQQKGIIPMINLGAFALHFGDKSLPKCTTQEQYAAADLAFMEKWNVKK